MLRLAFSRLPAARSHLSCFHLFDGNDILAAVAITAFIFEAAVFAVHCHEAGVGIVHLGVLHIAALGATPGDIVSFHFRKIHNRRRIRRCDDYPIQYNYIRCRTRYKRYRCFRGSTNSCKLLLFLAYFLNLQGGGCPPD